MSETAGMTFEEKGVSESPGATAGDLRPGDVFTTEAEWRQAAEAWERTAAMWERAARWSRLALALASIAFILAVLQFLGMFG